jgi:alpha-N-acetylglucosamine transferase
MSTILQIVLIVISIIIFLIILMLFLFNNNVKVYCKIDIQKKEVRDHYKPTLKKPIPMGSSITQSQSTETEKKDE